VINGDSKPTRRRLEGLLGRTRQAGRRERAVRANGTRPQWIQGSDHSLRIPLPPPKAY